VVELLSAPCVLTPGVLPPASPFPLVAPPSPLPAPWLFAPVPEPSPCCPPTAPVWLSHPGEPVEEADDSVGQIGVVVVVVVVEPEPLPHAALSARVSA